MPGLSARTTSLWRFREHPGFPNRAVLPLTLIGVHASVACTTRDWRSNSEVHGTAS
jgi:hypothetical protein